MRGTFFKVMAFRVSQLLKPYPQKSHFSDNNSGRAKLLYAKEKRTSPNSGIHTAKIPATKVKWNGNGKLYIKVDSMGLVEILFTNLARVHACNLVHKLRSPVVTRFFRAQSRGGGEVFS